MTTELPPVADRIADKEVELSAARALQRSFRVDSYDRPKHEYRVNRILDELSALYLERLVES